MRAAEAPVSAATVPRLMTVLADPDCSIARVAEVVSGDTGLAARILAVANSAAFGLSRQVTDVQQAVGLVGSNLCQTLAIAGSSHLLDDSLPGARAHAIGTGVAARWIAARNGLNTADAFAAGLLHDLGEILLWRDDQDTYAAQYGAWEDTMAQLRFERGNYETDHALVAREQLAEWRLPGAVVDAVGDHHRPDMVYPDLSACVICAEELLDPAVETSPRFRVFDIEDDVDGARREVAGLVEEMQGLLPV